VAADTAYKKYTIMETEKEVIVLVTVALRIVLMVGETIDNVMQECDYQFTTSEGTMSFILDTEIREWDEARQATVTDRIAEVREEALIGVVKFLASYNNFASREVAAMAREHAHRLETSYNLTIL
jgi:hypothetical protein